jgi:hypothetical protein
MAKNTQTQPAIADAADPVVDGQAEAAAMLAIEDAAAGKLVATFNDASDVFNRARIIAGAASRGASLESIARLLTAKRVTAFLEKRLDREPTEAEVTDFLADDKGVRKLKLSHSKSSMQQYDAAWRAVVDAGVRPTKETIEPMFRVKSTGGHAKPLASMLAELGDVEGEDRAKALIKGCHEVLDTLRSAKADSEGRNPGGSGTDVEGDEPTDGVSTVEVGASGVTADGAIGTIRAAIENQHTWSAGDRERVLEAASDLIAALMGEVEVPAEAEVAAA